jgi:phosphatidylglycerophosphate synthase
MDIEENSVKRLRSLQIRYSIPSLITLLRILAAPVFYYAFLNCSCAVAFTVFVAAAVTDILDGFAARKLNAASDIGAFLDVFADFFLIAVVFIAFLKKDWYCVFIFIPITLSFIGFIVSSGMRKPIYDPLGKYMGAFIMTMITITLFFPNAIARKTMTYSLLAFYIVTLISRMRYFARSKAR